MKKCNFKNAKNSKMTNKTNSKKNKNAKTTLLFKNTKKTLQQKKATKI
jgi:hypothetical protein